MKGITEQNDAVTAPGRTSPHGNCQSFPFNVNRQRIHHISHGLIVNSAYDDSTWHQMSKSDSHEKSNRRRPKDIIHAKSNLNEIKFSLFRFSRSELPSPACKFLLFFLYHSMLNVRSLRNANKGIRRLVDSSVV